MINLTVSNVSEAAPVSSRVRLADLLHVKERYFALQTEGERERFLSLRVDAIIQEFVLPEVVAAIRNRYEFVAATQDPVSWSDTEALYWASMPRPNFLLGGFHPLIRALAKRIEEVGGTPYELIRSGDGVVFAPM